MEAATQPATDVPADDQGDDDGVLRVWELAPDRTPIQFKKDEKVHYLRSVHSLSMHDRAEYDRLRKRSKQLSENKRQTKQVVDEREEIDRQLVQFVLPDATEDEIDGLHPLDRETAIAVFIAAFGRTMRKLGAAVDKAAGVSEDVERILAAAEADDETDDEPTPES